MFEGASVFYGRGFRDFIPPTPNYKREIFLERNYNIKTDRYIPHIGPLSWSFYHDKIYRELAS